MTTANRLVVSEDLLVRFIYLWMRDANLDPDDPYAQSHVEDHLRFWMSDTPLNFGNARLAAFARDAVRHAPPGVVLMPPTFYTEKPPP